MTGNAHEDDEAETDEMEPIAIPADAASSERADILVIDDNALNRSAVVRLLRRAGMSVIVHIDTRQDAAAPKG